MKQEQCALIRQTSWVSQAGSVAKLKPDETGSTRQRRKIQADDPKHASHCEPLPARMHPELANYSSILAS
jgi:hypothetical protein